LKLFDAFMKNLLARQKPKRQCKILLYLTVFVGVLGMPYVDTVAGIIEVPAVRGYAPKERDTLDPGVRAEDGGS
jgi:hypothetical protein